MTNSDYEKLLALASKKLGASPEQLKSTIAKGDMAGLSANLSKADKEKLRAVLANKELLTKLKSAGSPDEIINLLNK